MTTTRTTTLFSALALALAACGGGGGGGGGSVGGGVFVDSPVEGLGFIAGLDVGTTNAQGRFAASPGTTVLFNLGDVVLGLAPYERQLTPLSLVSGAMDETDPTVTNIARFLQSIDDDADPSNGIRIAPAVRAAGTGTNLKFDQSVANFEVDPAVASFLTAAGASGLVSVADAQAHLRDSLRGSLAGLYVGGYGGGDTGSFRVFVDRSGGIAGSAFSNGDQDYFGVSGTIALDGTGIFGNTTDMSTFTGEIGAGVLDGTWDNTLFSISGTFSGTRAVAPAFVLDAAELAPFVGSYTGTYVVPGETGGFTMMVLATGDLTFDDGEPGEVRATILSIAGGVATFAGEADDGEQVQGTILDTGTFSGTLFNPYEGVSGTVSGSM